MTARRREVQDNHVNKRGLVTERDGPNRRVRVQFPDEDETQSYWIDVIGSGSSANASYEMPDEGDEVWCALDISGEGGCVLGTRYNKQDRPPVSDPNVSHQKRRDGSYDQHDPSTKTREITAETMNLGPDGRTKASGVGHLVHVTYGSSMGLHPIVTGSPSVNIKE